MYDLWSIDTIQKKVIGQSLFPSVRDLLAAVEAAGLTASEKRKHPDKAVHSYNFDVDWAAARTGGLWSEQGPDRSNSRICGL